MSAGAIKAGEAFIRIWANDKEARESLSDMRSRLKQLSAEAGSAGLQLSALGAAMTAPFAASLKVFAGFEDQMAQVGVVSGATAAEFERLNKTAKDLGASTSFTAKQVAEGMTFLAMAGYDAEQSIAAIPVALNLARAGAMDLGRAADIVTDVSTAFGITANEVERVADVLTRASTMSNTNVTMMGESFQYAAAVAASSGQTIEEMAAAMAILANNGIKASMAGTGIRSMLTDILNPSTAAQEVIGRLGVSMQTAAGDVRPLLDILDDLKTATAGMSSSDRNRDILTMFGDRGGTAALAIINNTNLIGEYRKNVEEAAGTSANAAKQMDDTLGGSFRMLLSAVEGISISIGETLTPAVREFADAGTQAAEFVKSFTDANPTLVKVAAGLGALTAAAGAGGLALAGVAKTVAAAIGAYSRMGSAVSSASKALTGKAAVEKAAAEASVVASQKQAAATKIANDAAKESKVAYEELSRARAKDAQEAEKLALAEARLATAIEKRRNAENGGISLKGFDRSVSGAQSGLVSQQKKSFSATLAAADAQDRYANAATEARLSDLRLQDTIRSAPRRFASVGKSASGSAAALAGYGGVAGNAAAAIGGLSMAIATFTTNESTRELASWTSGAMFAASAALHYAGRLRDLAVAMGAAKVAGGGLVLATASGAAAALGGAAYYATETIKLTQSVNEMKGAAIALDEVRHALAAGDDLSDSIARVEAHKKATDELVESLKKQVTEEYLLRKFGPGGGRDHRGELETAEATSKTYAEQLEKMRLVREEQKKIAAFDVADTAKLISSLFNGMDSTASKDDGYEKLLHANAAGAKGELEKELAEVQSGKDRLLAERSDLADEVSRLDFAVAESGGVATDAQNKRFAEIRNRLQGMVEENSVLTKQAADIRERIDKTAKAVAQQQQKEVDEAIEVFSKTSMTRVTAAREEAAKELTEASLQLSVAREKLETMSKLAISNAGEVGVDALNQAAQEYDAAVMAFENAKRKESATDEGSEALKKLHKELDDIDLDISRQKEDKAFAKILKTDPFHAAEVAAKLLDSATAKYTQTLSEFRSAIDQGNVEEAERLRDLVTRAQEERDRAMDWDEDAKGRRRDQPDSGSRGATFSGMAALRMNGGGGASEIPRQQLEVEKRLLEEIKGLRRDTRDGSGLGA